MTGAGLSLTPEEERIKEQGLIVVLKRLHETIDRLTAEAYGWPVDLSDEEILERLVALNAERAREEAAAHVRWLRPISRIPRFAKGATAKTGELGLVQNVVPIDKGKPAFPKHPYEQPLAIEQILLASGRALDCCRPCPRLQGRRPKMSAQWRKSLPSSAMAASAGRRTVHGRKVA